MEEVCKISSVCGKEQLDTRGLDIELKELGERKKLEQILRSYNEQINPTICNLRLIPHSQHAAIDPQI